MDDVGSTVSAKERTRLAQGSVWKIWLKLYVAVIFLFMGFVTLALYLFLDVQSEANEVRAMALNLRIVRLIKTFTHEAQGERGVSALWIATRGVDEAPIAHRGRVDTAVRGFTDFIDSNLHYLDRDILGDLAGIQHFIERLPAIRGAVDAMPSSPDAVVAALTRGIADSHDVVVKLATRISLTRLAFAALAVADVLDMKEALDTQGGAFSVALSAGPLPPRSVMLLHAFTEEFDGLTENLLAKVFYLTLPKMNFSPAHPPPPTIRCARRTDVRTNDSSSSVQCGCHAETRPGSGGVSAQRGLTLFCISEFHMTLCHTDPIMGFRQKSWCLCVPPITKEAYVCRGKTTDLDSNPTFSV